MQPFFRRSDSEQPVTTALSRPTRLIADQETPYGEKLPKLTELARSLDEINAEYEQKRAALEAQAEKARALQHRGAALKRSLDHATDNLARAEEQHTAIQESIARVHAIMPVAWTKPNGADYSYMVSAKEALSDFPRVKLLLQEQVTQAQTTLANFKK
jgi:chromosome segregation ATPase